jgi:hypothetical protein
MDQSVPTENPEPEESGVGDYATRKIDPDELFTVLESESTPAPEAATEILTQAVDPASTVIVSDIPEPSPAVRTTPEPPPAPVASPRPVSPPAPANDNRVSMAVIIAVSVVALVCICACTIIGITALAILPSL